MTQGIPGSSAAGQLPRTLGQNTPGNSVATGTPRTLGGVNPPKTVGVRTGTGGFEIEGEQYNYDVGLPDEEGGSQGPYDKGDIQVDNSQKDITRPTKKVLASYLSKSTSRLNQYPIDEEYVEISIKDVYGMPKTLVPSTNEKQFSRNLPPTTTEDYNPLEYMKGRSWIDPGFARSPNGNELLSQVKDIVDGTITPEKQPSTVVRNYTSRVLKKNRFTPDNPVDPVGQGPSLLKYDSAPSALGKYNDINNPRKVVSFDKLAQIGPALTLRAGIEMGSNDQDFNPSSGAAEANALLPGASQAAVSKVNIASVSVDDVMASLYTNEEGQQTTTFINPNAESWGAMNNVHDPFSGISAFGMIALSAALVLGLEISLSALSILFDLIGKSTTKKAVRDDAGRYALGSYYQAKKKKKAGIMGAVGDLLQFPPDIASLIGIQPTNAKFSAALNKGLRSFFGFDTGGGLLGNVTGAIDSSVDQPGYNAVICRTIIRSAFSTIAAMKSIGGNPISVAKGVIGLVDVFRSSKLIAACNIFAQLGDKILSHPEDDIDDTALGGKKYSTIDSVRLNSAVKKSRLYGNLKLAWASNTSPTWLHISNSTIASIFAGAKLDAPDAGLLLYDRYSKQRYWPPNNDSKSRITGDEERDDSLVKSLESELDAEYVPFYFHDLRTNEIVSFHAFLASLNEDYTANYESSEAYGRMDPIKIYKNTHRKISLSFYVASTSNVDFDYMWQKINKLTTLVYPQYSAGRMVSAQVDGKKYSIRQPFSQTITAAPMVRLRLGDLFRSNYSRFNLAKLFGLGDPDMTLNDVKAESPEKYKLEALASYVNDALSAREGRDIARFNADSMHSYPAYEDKAVALSLGTSDLPKQAQVFNPGIVPNEILVVEVMPYDNNASEDGGTLIGKVTFTDDNDIKNKYTPEQWEAFKSLVDNGDRPLTKLIDAKFIFPTTALRITDFTAKKLIKQRAPEADSNFQQELAHFINGNAITKSFKSVEGKGLAGFIESMSFDWYDKVTWETEMKRAAPKMCKVTINFAPVHDISPGLDQYGFNRAPIYPIGPFSRLSWQYHVIQDRPYFLWEKNSVLHQRFKRLELR